MKKTSKTRSPSRGMGVLPRLPRLPTLPGLARPQEAADTPFVRQVIATDGHPLPETARLASGFVRVRLAGKSVGIPMLDVARRLRPETACALAPAVLERMTARDREFLAQAVLGRICTIERVEALSKDLLSVIYTRSAANGSVESRSLTIARPRLLGALSPRLRRCESSAPRAFVGRTFVLRLETPADEKRPVGLAR